MKKKSKLNKKKIKKIPKRQTKFDSSDKEKTSSDNSNDTNKNLINNEKEEKLWVDTLISEMENYEIDINSNDNSSSDSEKNSLYHKDKIDNIIKDSAIQKDINKEEKINTIDIQSNSINKYKNEEILVNNENINESTLREVSKDTILYQGKQFKNFATVNKYNDKRKIKKFIYKCQYLRKDKKLRKETSRPPFLSSDNRIYRAWTKYQIRIFF